MTQVELLNEVAKQCAARNPEEFVPMYEDARIDGDYVCYTYDGLCTTCFREIDGKIHVWHDTGADMIGTKGSDEVFESVEACFLEFDRIEALFNAER